jgi:AcrR family transcriptional regulator
VTAQQASAAIRRRTGGRSARVRAAVLDATLDTLLAQGPDRLSIADIAVAAGVHETSIYRRWRTKENLIIDALFARTEQDIPVPDTGSLRGDLIAAARSLAAVLTSPIGALLARASVLTVNDPAVAATQERYWATRFELGKAIVNRAIDRGELPPGTQPRPALDMLAGALHMRALLTHEPIEDDLPERLADTVLFGLHPSVAGAAQSAQSVRGTGRRSAGKAGHTTSLTVGSGTTAENQNRPPDQPRRAVTERSRDQATES